MMKMMGIVVLKCTLLISDVHSVMEAQCPYAVHCFLDTDQGISESSLDKMCLECPAASNTGITLVLKIRSYVDIIYLC